MLVNLLIVWGVVTALWFVLFIYRNIIEEKEEDGLYIDKAEEHLAKEQQELVARIQRLSKPMWALGLTSGVLLVVIGALWIRSVFQTF